MIDPSGRDEGGTMPKRKKRRKPVKPTWTVGDDRNQVRQIRASADQDVTYTVSCAGCLAEKQIGGGTPTAAARELYHLGWRHATSKEMTGVVCPGCLRDDGDD